LNEDPIFSVEELKPKYDLINREYTKLKNIKKPKLDIPLSSNSTNSKNNTSSDDGESNSKSNTKKTKNDKS